MRITVGPQVGRKTCGPAECVAVPGSITCTTVAGSHTESTPLSSEYDLTMGTGALVLLRDGASVALPGPREWPSWMVWEGSLQISFGRTVVGGGF